MAKFLGLLFSSFGALWTLLIFLGMTKKEVAFCLSLTAFMDVLARLLLPTLFDKLGFKKRTTFWICALFIGLGRSGEKTFFFFVFFHILKLNLKKILKLIKRKRFLKILPFYKIGFLKIFYYFFIIIFINICQLSVFKKILIYILLVLFIYFYLFYFLFIFFISIFINICKLSALKIFNCSISIGVIK